MSVFAINHSDLWFKRLGETTDFIKRYERAPSRFSPLGTFERVLWEWLVANMYIYNQRHACFAERNSVFFIAFEDLIKTNALFLNEFFCEN